jgi:hypothetical protein
MKLPVRGGLFLLSVSGLTGCVSPMTQREAQNWAQLSLRNYCVQSGPCLPAHFVKAQHLSGGWLLDYESDQAKYGVMVRESGNAQVSVWAKDAAPVAR